MRPNTTLKRVGYALAVGSASAAAGATYLLRELNRVPAHPPAELERARAGSLPPLLEWFPGLSTRLPWLPLSTLPTPVARLHVQGVPEEVQVWVKRDDLSSSTYGGNKVRKLEHLLAEAILAGHTTVVTLGALGSNHALATALHARSLSLATELILYDQPFTPAVRRNLGAFVSAGARVHYGRSIAGSFLMCRRRIGELRRAGERPIFINVGGTSRLGCLGHVSAGLELAEQVRRGELPEPRQLFVALGTGGTAAGLIVGLRLAGLSTRVAAVQVADAATANQFVVRALAQDLADFLHGADPTVPRLRILRSDFDVLTAFFGAGYGHPTAGGEAAIQQASDLSLETTYTGKALAACLAAARRASERTDLLFWNSVNSAPLQVSADLSPLPSPILRLLGASPRSS